MFVTVVSLLKIAKMSKNSKRKQTLNERLYTIGDAISPSFTLQFLIEGRGYIDANTLTEKLAHLAEQLPVLRLRLSGKTWSFDGKLPHVFSHDSEPPQDWNDPLFRRRLEVEKGVSSEFHLFKGNHDTLLFRVLHSAMDGKGAQLVLRNLFALLRNEPIHPNTAFLSDIEVLQGFGGQIPAVNVDFKPQWPGFSIHPENEYQIVCIRFDEKIEAPLAKIATWYAHEFGETCRMMIPVDLRRHEEVPDSASNLSLPIYLEVRPEQSWQEVQGDLLKSLSQKEELAREKFESLGMLVPGGFLKTGVKHLIQKILRKQRFPISAILSDNGFIQLADFSTPIFKAESVISLPVFVPLIPFCVNVIQHTAQTNIAFSIPNGIEMNALLERLNTHLLQNSLVETESVPSIHLDKSKIDRQELKQVKVIWADILDFPIERISEEVKFHDLGGDSLKLLAMLSELADEFELVPESAFINAALNTGGDLNLKHLLTIMHGFRPVHP